MNRITRQEQEGDRKYENIKLMQQNIRALSDIVKAIEVATQKPAQRSGKKFRLVCPLHGSTDRNLSISEGSDRVLLHCYSHGCDPKEILAAVGLPISAIYHEQLNPIEAIKYKKTVTDLQIKKELEQELLILLFWLADSYRNLFPVAGDTDKARVELAWKRVVNAGNYFSREGVK